MKKIVIFILLSCLVFPAASFAKRGGHDRDCRIVAAVINDGTGDNRTKKRGGNYAAIALNTLDNNDVLTIAPTSGTLKYVTLHARYQGGYWRTIYQGPITEFPVGEYFASYKKDPQCTHVNISVNGAHERYEPIACRVDIKVCGRSKAGCKTVGSVFNDGTGDNRTKKRGGNYAAIALNTLTKDDVLTITPTSGTLKYVTLHARFRAGYWRTIYQGPITKFPVDQYLAKYKKDPQCTHVNISVNGAHERYEPIACKADISVCRPDKKRMMPPPAARPTGKETTVALEVANGKYVSAEGGGGKELVANRGQIGSWESLTMIHLTGDKIALKASNGQFVSVESTGNNRLVANRATLSPQETFTLVRLSGNHKVALKAYNGKFVCAEGGGGRELVANRPSPGPWETFTLVEPSKLTKVALKAFNGQFVCAEGGGGRELVANRPSPGSWETFTLVKLPGNNKIALKAPNGQFVSAENGGGRELVANRPQPQEWETFTLVHRPGKDRVSFKVNNGQYVTVESVGNNRLAANRSTLGAQETFTIIYLP
jgi:hypothetical protein